MASMHLIFAVAAIVATASTTLGLSPGVGVVTVFYSSGWTKPYIHYDDGSGWTPVPGVTMDISDNATYPNPPWFVKYLPANTLTFVFNDGNNNWDNNQGKNYIVTSPGIYNVANGKLTTDTTFPVGCPASCSGHGSCSANYKCVCDTNWYGPTCSCGGSNPCSGHGSCDSKGNCVCNSPWATCGSSAECAVDLSSDTLNCGKCGAQCVVKQGITKATCSNSQCSLTCDDGYLLCNNGSSCDLDHCSIPPLSGCQTFHDNQCQGDQIETSPEYSNRKWFTPRPGDSDYKDSFGDYWRMTAYAHMEYNPTRTSATVQINAVHMTAGVTFTYEFNGAKQSSNQITFYNTKDHGPITVNVYASDGAVLQLQDLDFVWDAPAINRNDGDFRGGQKGAIIEFFGWPHKEVEAECQYVAKMGWAGVKLLPPQEQVMSLQPFNNILNPWYFAYQPASYRLESRMGTYEELKSLINTCRKYGVRVYADAVFNHMSGSGNDANVNHRNDANGACTTWPNKNTSAADTAPYYTQGFTYTYNQHTALPPLQEYPAVPYGPLDFHCERALSSWTDPLELNAGWLNGLVDLNTEHPYVQQRIADYLTSLISAGFSGIRVDAAKHIEPDDLVAIFGYLKKNLGGSLPTDFIAWLEVLLGGEAGMLMCDEDSGYNYGKYLEDALYNAGFSQSEVYSIKIWNSGYPKEPDADCKVISRGRNAIQNDDHDQQMPGSTSRDMGDYGSVLVKEKNVPKHRGFEEQLFTNPRGANDNDNDYPVRILLSSYYWYPTDSSNGIPDGLSDCSLCEYTCSSCTSSVSYPYFKAQDSNSCGYDSPSYTRTHRDKSVILAMRSWMHMSTNVNNDQLGLPSSCQAL